MRLVLVAVAGLVVPGQHVAAQGQATGVLVQEPEQEPEPVSAGYRGLEEAVVGGCQR